MALRWSITASALIWGWSGYLAIARSAVRDERDGAACVAQHGVADRAEARHRRPLAAVAADHDQVGASGSQRQDAPGLTVHFGLRDWHAGVLEPPRSDLPGKQRRRAFAQ